MSAMHCSLLSLGCAFGFAPPSDLGMTALRALAVSQLRLQEEVRSRLLSLSSARTEAAFAPEAWRAVYVDHGTSDRCRVVTVAARASSANPGVLEAFSSVRMESGAALQVMAQDKVLIDSHQALERVCRIFEIKTNLSLIYRLYQSREDLEPVWRLTFYGEGPEPAARFHIGATTGAVQSIRNHISGDLA